jgi:hypothetical protein
VILMNVLASAGLTVEMAIEAPKGTFAEIVNKHQKCTEEAAQNE